MSERKQRRLSGFDYSSAKAYFITACVKYRRHLFGEVRNGIMGLSDIGNAASVLLQQIPFERSNVILDEFMIMPNHIHCIIDITRKNSVPYQFNKFSKPVCDSVSMIVNHYKGGVTKWCKRNSFYEFQWQGRFHDHIIRNEEEHLRIKDYIRNNPRNWRDDRFFEVPTGM
jgi:putative transposase